MFVKLLQTLGARRTKPYTRYANELLKKDQTYVAHLQQWTAKFVMYLGED